MSVLPLEGKSALVTGAGVRLGRAIALALAGAGADVAVHYRKSAGPAREVVAEVRSLGRRGVALQAELAEPAACRELARTALRELGGLDVFVHSAASFRRAPLAETGEAVWDSAMNVNARSALLVVREIAPALRERGGRVVLLSDALASAPEKNYLAHCVSKAAVEGLVRALAVELAPEVSVNGLAPGTVLVPKGTSAETAARWAKRTLLQRNGDPADVADAVLFLCSGSGFLTGQVLRIDGGQSLT
jgi:pteridine reductase